MSKYNVMIGNLKSTIEGISGINCVYDYEGAKFSGYPAVEIAPLEDDDETLVTNQNEVHYKFKGKLLKEFSTENRETVEGEMRQLVDSMIDTIKTEDYSSSGALFKPRISGKWGYLETAGGWLRVYEFTIVIRAIATIS